MRTFFIGYSIVLLLALSSCRSLSYFESPNHLRNVEGTVYLNNGRSVKGKLRVMTDNLLGSPVKIYEDGDETPMQFRLDEIKAYTIPQGHFELKEIREGWSPGRQRFFMRRITPERSRLHLYEHLHKQTVNKTATRYRVEYYMQLPDDQETFVHASTGSRFVPDFHRKMSALVADCPMLAERIAAKTDGYFYAQVSLLIEKRKEVLLRIINEYNNCGRMSDE